jgi:phage terminase small subunit
MGRLRSWKRELFARAIAEGKEPKKAYEEAGYKSSSVAFRNYNRLLSDPDVIALINEYKKERQDRARAARVPIGEVLSKLDARGIHRVADFFDINQSGVLAPCNLRQIPVEISMALLRLLSDALGLAIEIKASRSAAAERDAGHDPLSTVPM